MNLTESEKHGVITTLKLFTIYEVIIGNEYWQNLVYDNFKRPADIQRMARVFSFMEEGVHAVFYSKINDVLGLANDAFYNEYLNDPQLTARVNSLHNWATSKDLTTALAALSFAEGVVLYSNFAFLKHFQSQGKNKLSNIVRGINFSVRDEAMHCEASSWLFRTLKEQGYQSTITLEEDIYDMAATVYEHEAAIVDKIFSKGKIEGITDIQMKNFIQSRVNLVLRNLGYDPLFEVKYNPIAEWFYKGINNYVSNDFFAGQGREYKRGWDESEFIW